MSSDRELISVVIPCHNQAHFLGEAIESILVQTYTSYEIVVVDDGSTDNTAEVAARYPQVRYVRQDNQGTASARNRGARESSGSYLVFLDADDRLLSEAFDIAQGSLSDHPECAFVFGLCRYITHDGSLLPISQPPYGETDHYLGMLGLNPIWHPAAIMCRRSVFDILGGFNSSLVTCSDYDFYLRIARRWPIYCHNKVISEYRQHSGSKSSNSGIMLRDVMTIRRSQRPFIKGNMEYEEAYRIGTRNFQRLYCENALQQIRAYLRTGVNRKHALQNMLVILRYNPGMLLGATLKKMYQLILGMQIKIFGGPAKV